MADRPDQREVDLSQFLPYRLSAVAERISQSLAGIYSRRYGIGVPEWRVLAWLSYKRVLTAKQICEHTGMDKARVSRAVNALVQRGVISRSPSRRDLRAQELRLTGAGEELLAELIPTVHHWESELVSTLSGGEYRDLLNIIGKLERRLEQLPGAGD